MKLKHVLIIFSLLFCVIIKLILEYSFLGQLFSVYFWLGCFSFFSFLSDLHFVVMEKIYVLLFAIEPYFLTVLILLPLIGVVLVLFIRNKSLMYKVSFNILIINFILSLIIGYLYYVFYTTNYSLNPLLYKCTNFGYLFHGWYNVQEFTLKDFYLFVYKNQLKTAGIKLPPTADTLLNINLQPLWYKNSINQYNNYSISTLIDDIYYYSVMKYFLYDKFFIFCVDMFWLNSVKTILGIDALSLFFIILTTFLCPLCILLSWHNIKIFVKEYLILFLFLESILIVTFSSLDLLIFFIFFESILVPMIFIIGIWGSRERKIHAVYQFFLYTLFGSILMLLAIIFIYTQLGSTSIIDLLRVEFSFNIQLFLWLAFFISFAIKIPMLPFHIWLPEAHVEAPTGGSVILAGILLKLGGYGFIRFSIPLFYDASLYFAPLMYTLSIIGIMYTSLATLRQTDLKKIIAYSSIGHMNFVTLGLFTFTYEGFQGSMLLMLSHGFVSSALFFMIGILYDRFKTRSIFYYNNLCNGMNNYMTCLLILILANMSIPGSSSFVGELLILVGSIQQNFLLTVLIALSTVFPATYSIFVFNRMCFSNKQTYQTIKLKTYMDLNFREFMIFLSFLVPIIMMGIKSSFYSKVLSSIYY